VNDVEEIRQLSARYNHAGDGDDLAGWLACFSADGLFRRSDGTRVWRGEEQLSQLFSSYPVSGRHLTSDHVIDVDGDSATQTCYLVFLDRARGFAIHMIGVYHDHLVRDEGAWRFSERMLEVDFCVDE